MTREERVEVKKIDHELSTKATLTIRETAEFLNWDCRAVARACDEKVFPSLRVGKRSYVLTQPFLELIEKGEHPNA